MIAMQYKIILPDTYDMNTIRKRVENNGCKTDGFQGLKCKAYLLHEKDDAIGSHNEYSPLYLWNNSDGMNAFIFGGFYDNILQSFGWQTIHIGIVLFCDFDVDFTKAMYVLKIEKNILPTKQMKPLHFLHSSNTCLGSVLLYNPETWKYVEYHFYEKAPAASLGKIYQILHISL